LVSTTKRLAKQATLVSIFRQLIARSPDDVLPAVYLCSNRLCSSHEDVELGVGGAIVSAAVCQATGASSEQLRRAYRYVHSTI
jgi:DNA ligase-1